MLKRNFLQLPLEDACIHEGEGLCKHATVFEGSEFATNVRFLNYTVVPVGGSFGVHTHGADNELYIVLEGKGIYEENGEKVAVCTGDIMVNAPFASHRIINDGESDLRLLVLEVYR